MPLLQILEMREGPVYRLITTLHVRPQKPFVNSKWYQKHHPHGQLYLQFCSLFLHSFDHCYPSAGSKFTPRVTLGLAVAANGYCACSGQRNLVLPATRLQQMTVAASCDHWRSRRFSWSNAPLRKAASVPDACTWPFQVGSDSPSFLRIIVDIAPQRENIFVPTLPGRVNTHPNPSATPSSVAPLRLVSTSSFPPAQPGSFSNPECLATLHTP